MHAPIPSAPFPKGLLLPAALLLSLAACAAPAELTYHRDLVTRQAQELDSLRAAHRNLWQQYGVIQDSLAFYDDIDSGQYYRDLNLLKDRIQRLEYQLAVSADGGATLETLSADDLFKPGTTDLTEAGARRLDRVAEALAEAERGAAFRVEGHSDNVAVGSAQRARFPSNWELSAMRAASVARYLIEESKLPPERFTVAAYADTRPLASNASAEGRRRNRRIRIAVVATERASASR